MGTWGCECFALECCSATAAIQQREELVVLASLAPASVLTAPRPRPDTRSWFIPTSLNTLSAVLWKRMFHNPQFWVMDAVRHRTRTRTRIRTRSRTRIRTRTPTWTWIWKQLGLGRGSGLGLGLGLGSGFGLGAKLGLGLGLGLV